MSTKTTIKRIALVAVSALGFGLLSVVTPANAAVATAMTVSVGPNGETSLTVVGSSPAALVRIDVTANDSNTGAGLSANETVTATVTGVPTGVKAKTIAANGGAMDSNTALGSGGADLIGIVSRGQTEGTRDTTAAKAISKPTNWELLAALTPNAYNDTITGDATGINNAGRGTIGSRNQGYVNMDTNHELSTQGTRVKSYYMTVVPRTGAEVIDYGVYTIQFQLTDSAGIVRATQTIKIDFVSASSKADGVITLTPSGNFVAGTSILPYDTQTGASAGASLKVSLKNRDGGLIRNANGTTPQSGRVTNGLLVTIQSKSLTAGETVFSDSLTATVDDTGTYGQDWGTNSTASPGNGTLQGSDGIYGVKFSTWPTDITSTTTGRAYQFWAGYGNATIKTSAFTLYALGGTGAQAKSPDVRYTDVLVTATGMSVADRATKSDLGTTSTTWTLPTTTTTGGSIKFSIQDSSGAAVADAAMTVTPTWSGTYGTASVTPASSTTATAYTTDANGNFTVTFTNTAPVAGATLTLTVGNAAGFGNSVNTVVITWAKPVATTLTVTDPEDGVYVKTSSSNTATILVTDQFGAAVSGEPVKISLANTTDANYSATTVISPITTGADGTATYTWTGGATAAGTDTFVFTSSTTAGATDSITVTYVATVPAVATMSTYYSTTVTTASPSVLLPVDGNIYSTGTTKLSLTAARNLSLALPNGATESTSDDYVAVRFYGLTSASAAAQGAVVTITAGAGGHILSASNLPVSTRNFVIGSTGYTSAIKLLATGTGDITFTATSGTVSKTFTLKVKNAVADARYVKLAAGEAGSVVASVTDRYGNGVAGAAVQISTTVGTLGNGQSTAVYTADLSGKVTVTPVGQGDATITATGTDSADYASLAGYVGSTIVDSSVTAGSSTATMNMVLAVATPSDAIDAANDAAEAANAATDAANAAAEAADAATAAAQDAQAAVADLAAQVATLISGIKAQITRLTNLVIKIQKKVNA